MNIHLTKVINTGHSYARRPGFYFYASWLPSMGFIPGALVQAVPGPGEMVFRLCDENIKRYSVLDSETKAQGGKLIQVFNASDKYKQSPTLLATGQFIDAAGFAYDDALIAKYTSGYIRVRKLPGTSRVINSSSTRDKLTGKDIPKLRLGGAWLHMFGFLPDSLVTASSEPGTITLRLWNEGAEKYRELVRFARQNQLKIVLVKEYSGRGKKYPQLEMTGSMIEKAGFVPSESLIASCEQGIIKIQKLDIAELGF